MSGAALAAERLRQAALAERMVTELGRIGAGQTRGDARDALCLALPTLLSLWYGAEHVGEALRRVSASLAGMAAETPEICRAHEAQARAAQSPPDMPVGAITIENVKDIAVQIVADFIDPQAPLVASEMAGIVCGTVLGLAVKNGAGMVNYGALVGVVGAAVGLTPPAEQAAVLRQMIERIGTVLLAIEQRQADAPPPERLH